VLAWRFACPAVASHPLRQPTAGMLASSRLARGPFLPQRPLCDLFSGSLSTPVPLRRHLHPHSVDTAAELGWSELSNGDLIAAAEKQGYELVITTDQNLRYQQNLSERRIAILVLMTTSWPRIKSGVESVVTAVGTSSQSNYIEIQF